VHIQCSTEAHHYVTWQKHDHSVAVACHACKKPRKEAPASSSKAMAAVSAENAPDMQDVLRKQTQMFMAAMREQLQGTNRVPVSEAAFASMHEMEGNRFELGMGMAARDVETKNDAIVEAGSKATINDEVLTREEKLQAQADAAGDERTVGTWEVTEKKSTPGIGTKPRTSLSRPRMLSTKVLNWITGLVACLFVLSFLSYVHNATHQMVTYVHGLFTENTCNRVSWIWVQSGASRTAGNVHMAAQAVMGTWLIAAIFFGVCVTPGATHNITRKGARMGMPAILPIVGHTMQFVSRTPIKDRAHTLGVPAESAK